MTERVIHWPRIARIMVAGLVALITATLIVQFGFWLIETLSIDVSATAVFYAIIAVGVVLYGVGWWQLIGFGDEKETPDKGAFLFLLMGALAAVGWVIYIALNLLLTA